MFTRGLSPSLSIVDAVELSMEGVRTRDEKHKAWEGCWVCPFLTSRAIPWPQLCPTLCLLLGTSQGLAFLIISYLGWFHQVWVHFSLNLFDNALAGSVPLQLGNLFSLGYTWSWQEFFIWVIAECFVFQAFETWSFGSKWECFWWGSFCYVVLKVQLASS